MDKSGRKTHMVEYLNQEIPGNRIKGFGHIHFDCHRVRATHAKWVDGFGGDSNAGMYVAIQDEAILRRWQDLPDKAPKACGNDFSKDFIWEIAH